MFPRGQRVLDGLAGVRAKGLGMQLNLGMQLKVSDTASFEIRMSIAAMIPYSILSPPLAAIERDELSARSVFKFSLPLPNVELMFGAAPPRTSVCPRQPVRWLRVPCR